MKTIVNSNWFVYILECSDKSFYTGITNNLARRLEEHNKSKVLSARYTRIRRPVRLVYSKQMAMRSEAMKREAKIKHLSREAKRQLILGR